MADTIAVTAPFRLGGAHGHEEQTEPRKFAPTDGVFRADAIDNFLKLHSGRGETVHATVALFRRYPKLSVFYVDRPDADFRKPGWYSQLKREAQAKNGHEPLTLGPFMSHLEAQEAWLRR